MDFEKQQIVNRIREIRGSKEMIYAFEHCGVCSECVLNNPAYRCAYLYECAKEAEREEKGEEEC